MMRRHMLPIFIAALAFPASAHANPELGKEVFDTCKSCHRIGEGAINISGPQLNAVIGRKAGSAEGFGFSKALKDAGANGLVWDEANLTEFLKKPQAFVKGTRMPFAGMKDEAEIKAVIAYLATFSKAPAPTSEVSAGPCAETVAATAALTADPAYGEYLSGECTTCHQVSGHADGIPAITGLPREVFVKALCEYKVQHRSHPVMNMVTGNLGNEEFAALAAYFGALN